MASYPDSLKTYNDDYPVLKGVSIAVPIIIVIIVAIIIIKLIVQSHNSIGRTFDMWNEITQMPMFETGRTFTSLKPLLEVLGALSNAEEKYEHPVPDKRAFQSKIPKKYKKEV